MKHSFTPAAVHLDMQLDEMTDKSLDAAKRGFIHAALTMRDTARTLFESNGFGYNIADLATSIYVTKVEDPMRGVFETRLTGLGTKKDRDSFKARFFITGTTPRYAKSKNGVSSYRGWVQATDAINRAINEALIVNYVEEAVNMEK